MCLGVPGKIIKKWTDKASGLVMAMVDFDGLVKEVCIDYNKEAKVGDYVMVHVGFSISTVDEKEAVKNLNYLKNNSYEIS